MSDTNCNHSSCIVVLPGTAFAVCMNHLHLNPSVSILLITSHEQIVHCSPQLVLDPS